MNRLFDKLPIIGKKIPGKITLSFLMLVFAILMHFVFKTFDRCICIVAMTFSFIGDVALNHKKNHDEQSKKDFIVGGISFIFAHICYCIAYYQKLLIGNYSLFNFGAFVAIAILLIVTVFMLIKINSNQSQKKFAFGLLYLWITGINYITIFSYSYSVKSFESFAAFGGLMFLVSDIIIGLENFSGLKSKLARELVWWLYPLGQILLIAMA